MPDPAGPHSALTLLRTTRDAPDAERIDRLCLSLRLDFTLVDAVIEALVRFPAGVQDALVVPIDAQTGPGPKDPSLLLALDGCHCHPTAADGTRTIRYAQAVLWDIRRLEPVARITLPDGTIRVCATW